MCCAVLQIYFLPARFKNIIIRYCNSKCNNVLIRANHNGLLHLPSDGALFMSSFIIFVTSLSSTTLSRAQPLCARVISCLIAVRKPWGLKKPVIQNMFGRPSNTHEWNWALRSRRSVNQNPRVADSQEICKKIKKIIKCLD